MYLLREIAEGGEIRFEKTFNSFKELKDYLIQNTDQYFGWINDNVEDPKYYRELPNFKDSKCLQDIEAILKEYDYSWWRLEVKELHWLDIICEENKTTIYEISRKTGIDKTTLFKIIKRNIKFNNIAISTIYYISKGLGMPIQEFIDKYFDRFFEK